MRITTLLTPRQWSFKHILGLVLAVGFAIGAVVLVVAQSPGLPAVLVKPPAPAQAINVNSTYFAPERLQAFSGNGFNLIPDLMHFLDRLEATVPTADASESLPIQELAQEYFRFVNHDEVQYQIYTVKRGDNFWKMAKSHGFTIDSIVGTNPHLEKIICYVNQKIILPSQGGSLHQVEEHETVNTIALDYGVTSDVILKANVINPRWGIIPGMWLFVPGAKPRQLTEEMHDQYSQRALFRSPLAGRYTSFVGKRIHPVTGFSKFHNGVDIACPLNTWVGASASGVVIYAGWGGAVGKYIKIDHQNGYQSVYGHLNKIYVKRGQHVRKGQLIGRSGATGRVTGPHLHFTIYKKGRVVNPMKYLW